MKKCFTWVICVYDSEDGLQRGAVTVQRLNQALVNMLQRENVEHQVRKILIEIITFIQNVIYQTTIVT